MPIISNANIVTGAGFSTGSKNARKLVRLRNGTLIAGVFKDAAAWQLYKSLDGGSSWVQIVNVTEAVYDFALTLKGNEIYVVLSSLSATVKFYRYNDSGILQGSVQNIENSQISAGNLSLVVNDAGTEIHAAWSSFNSSYPNSSNIRYVKGMISENGVISWGVPIQKTFYNSSSYDCSIPNVILDKDGSPIIIFAVRDSLGSSIISLGKGTLTSASISGSYASIYSGGSFGQGNPSAIFVPQSVNQLSNGRIWVAWDGTDSIDTTKNNVRTSYSDDGGATWVSHTKQTTGNVNTQRNASITADKAGKIFLYWESNELVNGTFTNVTKEKIFNGSWGTSNTISNDEHYGITALVDQTFSISMTRAPFIRFNNSAVKFSGNYNVGPEILPLSGALGDKNTPLIFSYAIAMENGNAITSIVEKINGSTLNTYSNPASLSRTFTIPRVNWDALRYFFNSVISVTVTDNNGMSNTQTYTFNKTLANDASLLEGTKAVKDGKDRVSVKRGIIAGQVGATTGSTFDAISAAIDARNVVKRQSGTATASGGSITISTLTFLPKSIMIRASATQIGQYNADMAINESRNGTTITSNAFSNITSSGFTAAISGTSVTWEAWN